MNTLVNTESHEKQTLTQNSNLAVLILPTLLSLYFPSRYQLLSTWRCSQKLSSNYSLLAVLSLLKETSFLLQLSIPNTEF